MRCSFGLLVLVSIAGWAVAETPLPPGAIARLGNSDRRPGAVDHLRFAPDGTTIRTLDGAAALLAEWDGASGAFLRSEPFRWLGGGAGAYSPDLALWCGRVGLDGVRVVERATGKAVRERRFPGVAVPAAEAFASDGKRVVVLGRVEPTPGEARRDLVYAAVWDFAADKVVTMDGLPDGLSRGRLSPDGTRLVTAVWVGFGDESEVALWDAATGRRLWALRKKGYLFGDPAFSPDGKRLVLPVAVRQPSWAGLEVYDAETARFTATCETGLEAGVAGAAGFSPDGSLLTLAVGAQPTALLAFDPATGTARYRLAGAAGPVAFAPDGKTFLTARPMHRWDAATGRAVWAGPAVANHGPARSLALSPDGTVAVVGGDDPRRTLRRWDVATGKAAVLGERFNGPVRFGPDGTAVYATKAAGYGDGTIVALDPATGKERVQFSCVGAFEPTWDQVIHRLEFRDGNRLRAWMSLNEDAVGQGAGWIEWDRATGKRLANKQEEWPAEGPFPAGIVGFAATPDGATEVRLFADRLEVWDATAKRRVREIAAPKTDGPWTPLVAVSADGTRAATAHPFGTVLVWELKP